MIHRPFSTAMVDLLLGTVIILLMAVNPPAAQDSAKALAKYTMHMSWNPAVDTDMDIYVWEPNWKCTISYQHQDCGFIHVDRDDRGHSQGTRNEEIIMFGDDVPDGDYYFSMHSYRQAVPGEKVGFDIEDDKGRPVGEFNAIRYGLFDMPPEDGEKGIFVITFKGGKIVDVRSSAVLIRKSGKAGGYDD